MTSPYSSHLLHEPVDAHSHPRPRRGIGDRMRIDSSTVEREPLAAGGQRVEPGHHYTTADTIDHEPRQTGSVTRVVAAPQQAWVPAPAPAPAPAPQVMYAQDSHGHGGAAKNAISTVALALVVLLVGIVALVGGYFASRAAAPAPEEAAIATGIAAQQGFDAGRSQGLADGRGDTLASAETTASLRASIARNSAFRAAYQRGVKTGGKFRAPVYRGSGGYGGYGGYRAPRYSGFSGGNYGVSSALGQAQNLANLTGAPVDVEIY